MSTILIHKRIFTAVVTIFSVIGYGVFVFAAGPFAPGATLDPVLDFPSDCSGPNDSDCYIAASGWGLTGNTGTDDTVNFIGTTDAVDFLIKTNNVQVAKFGTGGNIAIGGGFGYTEPVASGSGSFAIGTDSTASGDSSYVFGENLTAPSGSEMVVGFGNSNYTPDTSTGYSNLDRLFSIGNGPTHGGLGNAFTMWKDGSFAYNDDDFSIDSAGTDQNMFYFNYGNHDGDGNAQSKKAIRMGSAKNNEWDIGNALVGDMSIAVGFSDSMYGGPKASGDRSIAIGNYSQATGFASVAIGSSGLASGDISFAFNGLASGVSSYSFHGTASGNESVAIKGISSGDGAVSIFGIASGDYSYAFGRNVESASAYETVLGFNGTAYTPLGTTFDDMFPTDRLFNISNGDNDGTDSTSMGVWDNTSDAFTILKNGQVGIAIDNFEANNTGYTFEIGDGGTNVLGYFDNLTLTGWITTSDERKKHNIEDLSYGLDEIMQLRPVSFDFNFNDQHTIGFLAQQVLPIIPESVKGSEEKGYGMSYVTLVPVAIKAIQELDLKIETIEDIATMQNQTFIQSLIAWLGNTVNGLTAIHVDQQLCIGATCITESDLQAFKSWQGTQNLPPTPSGGSGDFSDNGDAGGSGDALGDTGGDSEGDSPVPDAIPESDPIPSGE